MKVVILAGGYGTRLADYTKSIPKPMVKIGKLPILIHIMNLYVNYGYKDFYIEDEISVMEENDVDVSDAEAVLKYLKETYGL